MTETQGFHGKGGILHRIVETKRREVETLRPREAQLKAQLEDAPPVRDFRQALVRPGEVALMAEVKRRSPGAGAIRPGLDPASVASSYQAAGAAAVSVLTDREYFGGGLEDLSRVREALEIPVFRKDFILSAVQLLEARVAGADGVLLIARILSDADLAHLHREALGLGLAPLVEVHGEGELERALEAGAALVGINNRNLQTFTTSLDVTLRLLDLVPAGVTVVSESGIRSATEIDRLGSAGVHAVLVGETLLRAPDPGVAAAELVGRPRVSGHGGGEPS